MTTTQFAPGTVLRHEGSFVLLYEVEARGGSLGVLAAKCRKTGLPTTRPRWRLLTAEAQRSATVVRDGWGE